MGYSDVVLRVTCVQNVRCLVHLLCVAINIYNIYKQTCISVHQYMDVVSCIQHRT